MNKEDLVEKVAAKNDMSKAQTKRVLDSILNGIKSELQSQSEVRLSGFGTFKVVKRAARVVRNPQTGALIRVKAKRVPKFKPAKDLKDIVR